MLRALILAMGLCGAMALTANAADNEKKARGPEACPDDGRAENSDEEIREKYDKDKDGKLSAEERKAISAEDKERNGQGGPGTAQAEGRRQVSFRDLFKLHR